MRYVITGANGFIGRALTGRLKGEGKEVTCVDLNGEGVFKLDITRPGVLDELLDSETVLFHLAARADVAQSVASPREDFETNMRGLIETLESARKYHCRYIFPSTASIFDPNSPQPLSERSIVRPSSPYGASKASGEAYCMAYHSAFKLDARIARLFSIYGPGVDRLVVYDIVKKIKANPKRISIYGDGSQVRDYLHIDDVISGLLLIAHNGQPGGDYNLASGVPIKIIDLVSSIARIMGFPDIEISPSSELIKGENPRWYGEISRIRGIGFIPSIRFEDGLRETVADLAMRI